MCPMPYLVLFVLLINVMLVCHCKVLFYCCCAFKLRITMNPYFVLVLKSERCIDISKTDNFNFLVKRKWSSFHFQDRESKSKKRNSCHKI